MVQLLDGKLGVPQQCFGALDDGSLCGEMLSDDVSICPVCGLATAWKNSKLWAAQFGKWTVFVKRALCLPTDDLGKRILKAVGPNQKNGQAIEHFPTPGDLERWRKIIAVLSEDEIREVFKRGWRDKVKDNGRVVNLRGYGLLAYVLNGCEKVIRERPAEVERESAFGGLG
jgi:hypothetical protein